MKNTIETLTGSQHLKCGSGPVILNSLSGVRRIGTDKWLARCPSHEDKSPSLSIRHTNGKTLLKCWTGCHTADVLASVGLRFSDLFDDPKTQTKPDPRTEQRREAAEAVERWREKELMRCAVELRERDTIIRHIGEAVDSGTITEDEALNCLADEYRGYSELEYRFECLRTNENVLEICREACSRETGRAA